MVRRGTPASRSQSTRRTARIAANIAKLPELLKRASSGKAVQDGDSNANV